MKIAIYVSDIENEKESIGFFENSPYIKKIDIFAEADVFLEKLREDKTYDIAYMHSTDQEGFLMEPVRLKQLLGKLEKLKSKRTLIEEKLVIRYMGKILLIPMGEILYLESQLHKTKIVLKSKAYQCNECLEKIYNRLNRKFIKCHKSYIVNMDYISEFCRKEIVLSTEQRIPVSKNRYADTKRRILEYLDAFT